MDQISSTTVAPGMARLMSDALGDAAPLMLPARLRGSSAAAAGAPLVSSGFFSSDSPSMLITDGESASFFSPSALCTEMVGGGSAVDYGTRSVSLHELPPPDDYLALLAPLPVLLGVGGLRRRHRFRLGVLGL